jgi:gliding motility-associated-like protein
MKKIFLYLFLVVFSIVDVYSQIVVTQGISPASGVQNVLLGSGVTITNITYNGVANSFGTFTTGSTPTNLGITSGLVISTGLASGAAGLTSGFASTDNGRGSDPQLDGLVSDVQDAAVLEFDFIPLSDTVQFKYVFASEEYPEYANSTWNDVFGFFITGPNPFGAAFLNTNIARIPGTNLPVTINNINNGTSNNGPCEYCQYYVNNQSPVNQYIQYDGMTTVLTAVAAVVPCQVYHIKIAIGDVGDGIYDSGVFLEANSFSSPGMNAELHFESDVRENSVVEGCSNADIVFRLPAIYAENVAIHFTTGGSAIRDVDYTIFPDVDSLVIPAGSDTGYIHITPIQDNILDPGDTIYIIIPGLGCSNTIDTLKIPVIDNSPIILTVADDQLLCDGGVGNLTVSATQGVSPYTFSWSNGVGNVLSQEVEPLVTTTYYVSATDLCNNHSTDSIKVTVGSLMYTISNDTTVCSGTPLSFSASFDGNITWTGYPTNPISVVANQSAVYSVIMGNVCGTVYDTVRVTVFQMPSISIGSNATLCDYETRTLALNGTYNSTTWYESQSPSSMGNIVSSATQYTTNQTGIYFVVATNGFCSDTASIILTFVPCEITAPNIITPNGDGFNDVLKFTNLEYYSNSNLVVYNRWGRVVYRSESYNNDWNGGGFADGIYYYILNLPMKVQLIGTDGWTDVVSGSLTIMR